MEDLKNSQNRDSRSKDSVGKAKVLALKLLSYRLRSESEIRERLLRKGFIAEDVNKVIEDLKTLELIDDMEAARSFLRNAKSKLLGAKGIKEFLLKRGIPAEIIEEVINDIDEFEGATLLLKKWLKTRGLKAPDEIKRFRFYMLRRGYSHDTINKLLRSLKMEEI